MPSGSDCWNWVGGRVTNDQGYVRCLAREHPRADNRGYVPEHVLIVESAIGKHLRKTAEVHHVNSATGDNRHENLVACENHAYHMLLHRRTNALAATGNANALKCQYCKNYDTPDRIAQWGTHTYHLACHNAYQRTRYARNGGRIAPKC